MPIDNNQKYLIPLLNSSLVEFFFRTISVLIRGGYLRFIYQYVTQIPICRIAFTTPHDERTALAAEATHTSTNPADLLTFVEERLAAVPEQADVVYDVLVSLAEQMLDLNKQRQEKLEDFTLDLESVLSDSELQRLERLWTPINTARTDDTEAAKRLVEAQEQLGALATQQLDLREDIGRVDEEQWKWLVRRRLGKGSTLPHLVRVYRTRQPAIAALDKRIAETDQLIDQVVYRLYGLTADEIAVVEGKSYGRD